MVSNIDYLIMIAVAIAVAAAVLVGFLLWLYAWALRRRKEIEGEERFPPSDDRYEIGP